MSSASEFSLRRATHTHIHTHIQIYSETLSCVFVPSLSGRHSFTDNLLQVEAGGVRLVFSLLWAGWRVAHRLCGQRPIDSHRLCCVVRGGQKAAGLIINTSDCGRTKMQHKREGADRRVHFTLDWTQLSAPCR